MKCLHMNGAGNDFMVIDGRGLDTDYAALAIRLCAMTGADGFMAVDHSECADFRLHFYNSDGTRGEMCGNGARCISKYAFDHGMAGENMTIQTDAGIVPARRVSENCYRVWLNLPTVLEERAGVWYAELGDPGLPHAVIEMPELHWEARDELRDTAKKYRFCPEFPKGANVNFCSRLDEKTVRILTYERGVEDYTLACGTGSGATAAVLWKQGRLKEGVLIVKNPGGDLTVTVEEADGRITALMLEGPAVVQGEYEI